MYKLEKPGFAALKMSMLNKFMAHFPLCTRLCVCFDPSI